MTGDKLRAVRLLFGLLVFCAFGVLPVAPVQASADSTSVTAAAATQADAAPSGPAHALPTAFAPRRLLLEERLSHPGAIDSPTSDSVRDRVPAEIARWRRCPHRTLPDSPDH